MVDRENNIQLIWLDENLNRTPTCQYAKKKFLEFNENIQMFTDIDQLIQRLKSIHNEQIFLIISGALARKYLSQIHSYRSIYVVFIFCFKPQNYQPLIHQYKKLVGIYSIEQDLIDAIQSNIDIVDKQPLPFYLFDQKQKCVRELSKESATFLSYQMFILVLKQIPQDNSSRQQMIELCQQYYQTNPFQLKKIDEFHRSYQSHQAIRWYTEECFLYRLINKALRSENIQLLFLLRFYIIDLISAIEKQHERIQYRTSLCVYRGSQIPRDELKKLQANIGRIVSMNGFLSTSKDVNVALQFASPTHVDEQFESVIYKITTCSHHKSVHFVDIEQYLDVKGENEVLFNLNTTFTIESIHRHGKVWIIDLKTTDQGSEKLFEYFELIKNDIEEYSPMIYLGRLIRDNLGQIEQSKNYFHLLLNLFPENHSSIHSIYHELGNVYERENDLNQSLKYYQMSYDIRSKLFKLFHPLIANSCHGLASIYRRKKYYEQAISFYRKVLDIDRKLYPNDQVKTAMTLEQMALVYLDRKQFDQAMNHLKKALEIYERFPHQDLCIASCLGFIGSIYEEYEEFENALNLYKQQMSIREAYLPYDHSDLLLTYEKLGQIYKKNGQFSESIDFCQMKLNEQKKRLGDKHLSLVRILILFGDIVFERNWAETLDYYQQALDLIQTSKFNHEYQLYLFWLKHVAILHYRTNRFTSALEYLVEAFKLSQEKFSIDHIDIAHILCLMASIYKKQDNRTHALEFYQESLLIYQKNYPSDNEKIREIQSFIIKLNSV